jgi:2-polyprenyl-6-methoxyphenol hydroxylase-like FAD-dependent oxidoreductase
MADIKVLGLSVAMELVEKGVKVAIVGRELPQDLDSAGFASPWAVCISSHITLRLMNRVQIGLRMQSIKLKRKERGRHSTISTDLPRHIQSWS